MKSPKSVSPSPSPQKKMTPLERACARLAHEVESNTRIHGMMSIAEAVEVLRDAGGNVKGGKVEKAPKPGLTLVSEEEWTVTSKSGVVMQVKGVPFQKHVSLQFVEAEWMQIGEETFLARGRGERRYSRSGILMEYYPLSPLHVWTKEDDTTRPLLVDESFFQTALSRITNALLSDVHAAEEACEVGRSLARRAWPTSMTWMTDKDSVQAACSPRMHRCFLSFCRWEPIVKASCYSSDVERRALQLLQRITMDVAYTHKVSKVTLIPVCQKQLSRLEEAGMPFRPHQGCKWGAVDAEHHVWYLPSDANVECMLQCIASLFDVDAVSTHDTSLIGFGNVHREEGCMKMVDGGAITLSKPNWSERGCELKNVGRCDGETIRVSASEIPTLSFEDGEESRCSSMNEWFPSLSRRFSEAETEKRLHFARREVLTRTITTEWTLEGMDVQASPLSSLGLSLLLALLLGGGMGFKALVALDASWGACLAVPLGGKVVLVDPTMRTRWPMQVVPSLNPEAGMIVEIKKRTTWKVAHVLRWNESSRCAHVRFLWNGKHSLLLPRAHVWRCIASPGSQASRLLISCKVTS